MIAFVEQIKERNETLFYFGLLCLVFALICLVLTKTTTVQVYNVNAWFKPFKFSFSTFLYSWAMAWFCYYLSHFNHIFFNWTIVVLLGFEIIYIAIQANKGQLSHFNLSSSFYSLMYSLMAFAASAVTLYTAYVGILFCTQEFPNLPDYYVWSIRLGILLFVIFAFEGFVMGAKLTHTIGGPDGESGIWLLNWSTKYGDPRIAHFIGMHALQVLPLLAYYVLKNTKAVLIVSLLYGILAVYTLVVALQGKSMFK